MPTNIQTILNNEREVFLSNHYLDKHEMKAYNYMAACKTEVFGFNAYECEDCGYKKIHYCSCGDRHCPSCQVKSREEWISKFEGFLLDINYFHCVFTVPDLLNELFENNKQEMYSLLFKTSSKTLLKVTKPLYGQIGFTSILHTWGQNLWFHPHIHMIVSGGGIYTDESGNQTFKKSPINFLAAVKVLSRVFRGMFLNNLYKLKLKDSYGNQIDLRDEPYKSLMSELYSKEWVVYSKKPFNNTKEVLNYIGRYSHRVAISNSRIKEYDKENHTVTFKYKDYKDNNKKKEMTLAATEFVRRFMQHILPSRFIKIRHYGFMSNSNRKALIPLCRKLLNEVPRQTKSIARDSKSETDNECRCPKCKGKMIFYNQVIPEKISFSSDTT